MFCASAESDRTKISNYNRRMNSMWEAIKSSLIFKRIVMLVVLGAFAVSVFMIVRQIGSDFDGWLTGLIVAVVTLGVAKPFIMNTLWALQVTFIMPVKWGRALGERLSPDDSAGTDRTIDCSGDVKTAVSPVYGSEHYHP